MQRKHLLRGILVIAVLFLLAEAVLRFGFGLGNPPLSIAHPTIEYLTVPGRYYRFGNRIEINRWHMRSPEADALDVLVLGDSVVNGGAPTDQADLATTLLAERLDCTVGNASAGSWGPQNMLAYVEQFRPPAEVLVVVLSDHDAWDVPTYNVVGVSSSHPDTRPLLAITEFVTRYARRTTRSMELPTTTPVVQPVAIEAVSKIVSSYDRVIVALHHERTPRTVEAGLEAIRAAAEEGGATIIDLHLPASTYRDNIHPNPEGQQLIADQLEPVIRATQQSR